MDDRTVMRVQGFRVHRSGLPFYEGSRVQGSPFRVIADLSGRIQDT
jgi:hypothetical protein